MDNSFRDLIVWQKSMNLVTLIYELTEEYPKIELFVLVAQMRRCAISIPSNIAEGRRRGSRKEYHQFLQIAFGSGGELETQLEISKRLGYCSNDDFEKLMGLLDEIMKMLCALLKKI